MYIVYFEKFTPPVTDVLNNGDLVVLNALENDYYDVNLLRLEIKGDRFFYPISKFIDQEPVIYRKKELNNQIIIRKTLFTFHDFDNRIIEEG